MNKKILSFSSLLVFCFACENNPGPENITPPETVIKRYQKHVDNNEFASAILLSTPEGAELIQEVAASLTSEELEMAKLNTRFHSIECKIEKPIAVCICEMEDEYERYEAEFILVLEEDQWLVDAPETGQNQTEINEIVDGVLENVRN